MRAICLCGSSLGLAARAPPPPTAVTMLEQRVAASSDDAEENAATGGVNLTSGDLELVRDGSTAQGVGIRFPDQAIPADATITDAWLQFEADEAAARPPRSTLQAIGRRRRRPSPSHRQRVAAPAHQRLVLWTARPGSWSASRGRHSARRTSPRSCRSG